MHSFSRLSSYTIGQNEIVAHTVLPDQYYKQGFYTHFFYIAAPANTHDTTRQSTSRGRGRGRGRGLTRSASYEDPLKGE